MRLGWEIKALCFQVEYDGRGYRLTGLPQSRTINPGITPSELIWYLQQLIWDDGLCFDVISVNIWMHLLHRGRSEKQCTGRQRGSRLQQTMHPHTHPPLDNI